MADPKEKLHDVVPTVKTLKEIGTNKHLAKFGDTITNLIYSYAKSILIRQLDQRKVNRTVLANALKNAQMKKYCKTRANSHDMANTVEAFIGYMYSQKQWTIEQMVDIMLPSLEQYNLEVFTTEMEGATMAFTVLLEKIKTDLHQQFEEEV